jgi:hypothetical protein
MSDPKNLGLTVDQAQGSLGLETSQIQRTWAW